MLLTEKFCKIRENEYQKQFSDWQKIFFDTWLESLANVQGETNLSQAQKKFWEDYI
jgi:hypothetical protein